jgi:hypothetical protein
MARFDGSDLGGNFKFREPYYDLFNDYPTAVLPESGVIVVRTAALRELAERQRLQALRPTPCVSAEWEPCSDLEAVHCQGCPAS